MTTPIPGANDETAKAGRSNFIRDAIDEDLAAGRHTTVVTRFPPEPNGFLHIGHAKAICLNFGIAEDYGGRCNLRFDDTNPLTEKESYVVAIERDIAWLGFTWGRTLYASDYFEQMYDRAEHLVRRGLAYVDSDTPDEVAARRGTVSEPGRDSPYRNRGVEENLDLLRRMRAGEFADGTHVLRARIDMAHPNMLLRDPLLYRIRKAHHYRRGDAWSIYPMYDWAHPLEDAFEGVTHSLCSLEFETHRPLYDWVIRESEPPSRPKQIEFARLSLSYTVLSKRYLLQLVQGGHVTGWDDPRMPTIAGLRRRGVLPESIRRFADLIGVARANSTVDLGKLEFVLRDDLSTRAPRVLCVQDPLEVVVTNWPEDRVDRLDAPYWPPDVPREGSRPLPFARRLLIEKGDFADVPPRGWHRLSPGAEVRLRHAYVIRCDAVERDAATGAPVRLLCTADLDTLSAPPKGRKVPGTIHWLAADHAVPCEVRLFDRLFTCEAPGTDPERSFLDELNPESLVVMAGARIEPAARDWPADTRLQFERHGYFWADPVDSRPERPVYNRIVPLKDTWAKIADDGAAQERRAPRRAETAKTPEAPPASKAAPPRDDPARDALAARGVHAEHADVLLADPAVLAFFEATAAHCGDAALAAAWTANEIVREAKARPLAEIPVTPERFAALLRMVAAGTISATAGKDVFAAMAARGGDPAAIVDEMGLRQVSDSAALVPVVDSVLAGHPDEVARYRAGNAKLIGFFVGKVIGASGGRANPGVVRALLQERLG